MWLTSSMLGPPYRTGCMAGLREYSIYQTSEALSESMANYRLKTGSGPPPAFLNQVLLEHRHAHSFTQYLQCFMLQLRY